MYYVCSYETVYNHRDYEGSVLNLYCPLINCNPYFYFSPAEERVSGINGREKSHHGDRVHFCRIHRSSRCTDPPLYVVPSDVCGQPDGESWDDSVNHG